MKKFLFVILAITLIVSLAACGEKKEEKPAEVKEEVVTNVPKNEQTGTAGSNMPLKDRPDDAEYEIKVAFQDYLKGAYGEAILDARIYVEKMYSAEEEQAIDGLKEMNLGPDEVAFEVRYELKPAEGTDVNLLTAASGEYDEESGWITEKYNLGILRPSTEGEAKYVITNLGTGW